MKRKEVHINMNQSFQMNSSNMITSQDIKEDEYSIQMLVKYLYKIIFKIGVMDESLNEDEVRSLNNIADTLGINDIDDSIYHY